MDGSLSVSFSEPVALAAGAFEVACERSGMHFPAASGGPISFSFVSDRAFLPGERCLAAVHPLLVSDLDSDDPPDHPMSLFDWPFRVAAERVLINELDAVSAEDRGEFIELYDSGQGDTDLSGLTLVFYGVDGSLAYLALELDGFRTDEDGYFVLGDSGVAGVGLPIANGIFLDAAGAVAIYDAPADAFPLWSAVPELEPIDAVVYGAAGPELLALLQPGEPPLDEDGRGAAAVDSNQRCPDGGGLPLTSGAFVLGVPTPGAPNHCTIEVPPTIAATVPALGARGIPIDAFIEITFSEEVVLDDDAIEIACSISELHTYSVEVRGTSFRFVPDLPFVERETCTVEVFAHGVADADAIDPPDRLENNYIWTFHTVAPVAENVLINEVDADTPGIDAAEFIELFDGGVGNTVLDGLSIVLFNGEDDRSYLTLELDGYSTDADGYFVMGNEAVSGAKALFAGGLLQNGPDAVALVAGSSLEYPDGTTVTDTVPFDAFVYSRPAQVDPELQSLLEPGQPQVDENGRGDADAHSSQRCPNGAGGLRMTTAYKQNTPTPGTANDCVTDTAPSIESVSPANDAHGIGINGVLTVEFSEPVTLGDDWLNLSCESSGVHAYQTTGGPVKHTLEADSAFHYSEICSVAIQAALVSDLDADDPPDVMEHGLQWTFATADPPADFVLINEIDANTPGDDEAEFIEIYDGGIGRTRLDGLVLVLFNGNGDQSYRAIDLGGLQTDERGYFVIGNSAVNPDFTVPNGTLQNGPDAVALYVADVSQFPSGTAPRQSGLVDAVVYGDASGISSTLVSLLLTGQNPIDEDMRGSAGDHSLQRCPNGAGGQRQTEQFIANRPTPGEENDCIIDEPPRVSATLPVDGATAVSIYSALELTFTEPVKLASGAIRLTCSGNGLDVAVSGGPRTFRVEPAQPLPHHQLCRVQVKAMHVTDIDHDDPPDHPAGDFTWSFLTAGAPADFVLINEIDADTPGSDTAEFIELFDGGAGRTDLSGLVLVFYNGSDDRSYRAIDLAGAATDGQGYLVIGNPEVAAAAITFPNGTLQNGADAVALFAGSSSLFANGTPVHTQGLIDAVVYGTDEPEDTGLLDLLAPGERQVNESDGGASVRQSSGRCPNGEGGQRKTAAFRQGEPSPGAANNCIVDDAPAVIETRPADGASGIDPAARLMIRFSEQVVAKSGWFTILCDESGAHAADVSGGPMEFTLTPRLPFNHDERCEVTIIAAKIADADNDDPPDHLAADFVWSFRTSAAPPVADFVLINEFDADTPGSDTAEFIELYDGGVGHTSLNGLVTVFWNGNNDKSYRVIDLTGHETDAGGYFVIGNRAVSNVDLVFADAGLQNGPDAVGLYAGRPSDFANGSPLTTNGLIDAGVYGPVDEVDADLLALLEQGQPQLDEAARGDGPGHSLQRCPDGAGGPRITDGYRPDEPTPGAPNRCRFDEPPGVLSHTPGPDAADALPDSSIEVVFSEEVIVGEGWYEIKCDASGRHAATVSGGPGTYAITPTAPFAPDEWCQVTLFAEHIRDSDSDDPPDHPAADVVWRFRTLPRPSVNFTTNSPLWIGETAVLSGTVSGPGPLVARWDFGDGRPPVYGASASHRYTRPGAYVVTLEAAGPSGTAIHRETVVVQPRALYWPVVGGW